MVTVGMNRASWVVGDRVGAVGRVWWGFRDQCFCFVGLGFEWRMASHLGSPLVFRIHTYTWSGKFVAGFGSKVCGTVGSPQTKHPTATVGVSRLNLVCWLFMGVASAEYT